MKRPVRENRKIEVHAIYNYTTNRLNCGENGEVKTITVGGDTRARISSPAKKTVMRDNFGGFAVRTKRLAEELAENGLRDGKYGEDMFDVYRAVYGILSDSKCDSATGKWKTDQAINYSKEEMEFIREAGLSASKEMIDDIVKVLDKGKDNLTDLAKALNGLHDKFWDKRNPALKPHMDGLRKATSGREISIFGRMSTGNIAPTEVSAIHMNHMYSIDEYQGECDFFSAVDTFVKTGAAHLDAHMVAGNVYYGYMNIDPVQIYNNRASQRDNLTDEEKRELAWESCEDMAEIIKSYLYTHPTGGQNAMATYPLPSVIVISVVKDGPPVSYDNAFAGVIEKYGKKSIPAIAAERIAEHLKYDAPHFDYTYRVVLMDSTCRKDVKLIDDKGNTIFPEDIHTEHTMNEIDSILENVAKEAFKSFSKEDFYDEVS